MSGLLKRAHNQGQPHALPASDPAAEAGSDEEQREILAEIDQIAADNKIMVTPETFVMRAHRGGAAFPLLVNLVGAAVLAGGIWGMVSFYQQEEAEVRSGSGITVTAESRLIEELRRQTEQRLAEKEEEISSIQAQLASVRQERIGIEESIVRRVNELELDLRAQLDAELESERARLMSEGFSEQDIEQLLRDYERRRIAELRAQVEAYRAELEREQLERAEALALAELDLSRSLDETRRERTAILEDSRRREDDLRTQYEERLARQSQEVAEAQQQLAAIGEQRDRETLVQNQITGFYERIRAAVAAAEYQTAIDTIEQFRAYLDQESVRSLTGVQQRRAGELFVLEALSRLVEPQIRTQDETTEDLLARAQRLGEITRLIEQAELAQTQNRPGDAEAIYREALSVLPGALDGHRFLLSRDQDRDLAVRRALISSRIEEADRAVQGGSPELALDLYEQAISDMIAAPDVGAWLVPRIRDAGALIVEQQLAEQFRAELVAMEADTRAEVERVMQTRITALQRDAEQQARQYRVEIEALEARLAEAQQDITLAQSEQSAAESRTESLERELELEQQRLASPESTDSEEPVDTEPSQVVDPQMLAELQRLRRLEGEVLSLRASYDQFRRQEDQAVGTGSDPFALIEGKLMLDAFLRSSEVQRVFPEIAQRVNRYDAAFQATGRRAALLDTMEIVYNLAGHNDPASRQSYLLSERSRTNDPELSEFLDELFTLVVN